jgi:hypothetical protein
VTGLRALRIIGVIEAATLALLLLNLVTMHWHILTSVLGPVHGLAYLSAIIVAVLISAGSARVWLWALIPGVGGLLAVRNASNR